MTRALFWLTLAVILAVSVGHVTALVAAVENGNSERIGMDYRAFVAAGELIRSGQGAYLYEPMSLPFLELAQVGFVYPPWAALFMIPWSVLPFGMGLVAWTLAGLTLMFVGLRSCGIRDWRPVGYAMITFPAVFALGLGQSSFWFVGVVALGVGAMQRQRDKRAGITLGLAGWKPHLLGGFALLWISYPRRYVRQMMSFGVATVVLILVSAFLLPGSWTAWLSLLFESVDGLASAELESSLPGMISLLAGSLSSMRWIAVAFFAIILIPSTVVVLRRGRGGLMPQLGLTFSVSLLLMPHIVIYDNLVLLIPVGLALQSRFRRDATVTGSFLALGLSMGPWLTRVQVDMWGRALDISTLSVASAALVFAFWVLRDEPILLSPDTEYPAESSDVNVAQARHR